MAVVRERGYEHWDGRLAERRFPWWPIARTGVRLAFRKKGFKFAFAGAFIQSFLALGGIYVSERLEDFKAIVQSNRALIKIDPTYFTNFFLTNGFFLFMLVLVLAFGTAGLVSEDLKHSALQLYFARPISKKDYITGKLAVVAFFVLMLTALPGLLLVLFKLIFAGSLAFLGQYPWLPVAILGYAAVLTLFFGGYVLLLSASSRNTRYVIVLLFGAFYFSGILAEIVKGIFRTPYAQLLSLPADIRQVGAALLGARLPYAVPPVLSFAVLAGICGLSAVVLLRKVRGVEVIK
jgi:ABC-type transport system involved in multi-copper enzyme maturation permease subunit